jgi:hypothetical protein
MNDGVALCDPGLQHLEDGAVIGLKIGLLDGKATHGQQPLLDYLPHSAQIARRRRNKNLRALACRSSTALICLRRTFAHFASGIETLENSRTHVWRVRPPAAMREQAFIADWSWLYSITLRSCTAILKGKLVRDRMGWLTCFFALGETEEGLARN